MLPLIAISMGDPGGIGPEVLAKALARADVHSRCRCLIVGSADVLQVVCERVGIHLEAREISNVAQIDDSPEVFIWNPFDSHGEPFKVGRVAELNGRAAACWIGAAAAMAIDSKVNAICTAPISKEAIYAAGVKFPGHTEMLADLCGGCDVRMMLTGGGLNVVLQTIHVPLADVPRLLSTRAIESSFGIIHDWWQRYHKKSPRVAVCGLNPHAGEGGHFGTEELEIISPAVRAAQERGMQISGPYPADTVFHQAREGSFDVVLAMYHDQALIPVKTLDFHGGVNVTLGLPIIRTSPDHGTAFEIAGRGVANESSMAAAICLAAGLAERR
jgi:4-hydroxythreonine-4-phosphate dehydrogenase